MNTFILLFLAFLSYVVWHIWKTVKPLSLRWRFLILSKDEIEKMIVPEHHIVISIRCNYNDPCAQLPVNNLRKGVLFLQFLDSVVDGENISRGDAQELLRFVLKHKENSHLGLIVCQCVGGISRSAGVAAALYEILNGVVYGPLLQNPAFSVNYSVYRRIMKEFMNTTIWPRT